MRPSLHWPTFNLADSGITVGLVLLFLEMLFVKKAAKEPAAPAPRKA
jgi:lipoprotein signal peptidase